MVTYTMGCSYLGKALKSSSVKFSYRYVACSCSSGAINQQLVFRYQVVIGGATAIGKIRTSVLMIFLVMFLIHQPISTNYTTKQTIMLCKFTLGDIRSGSTTQLQYNFITMAQYLLQCFIGRRDFIIWAGLNKRLVSCVSVLPLLPTLYWKIDILGQKNTFSDGVLQ